MELSPQCKPNRARAGAGWKIGQLQRPIKFCGPTHFFETIAAHYTERAHAQCGTVCRDQDMGVSLRDCKRTDEQVFKIILDPKCFPFGRPRKSGRIENNGVEFFASSGEPRQHRSDVISNEPMVDDWQLVQSEILASACEIFLR